MQDHGTDRLRLVIDYSRAVIQYANLASAIDRDWALNGYEPQIDAEVYAAQKTVQRLKALLDAMPRPAVGRLEGRDDNEAQKSRDTRIVRIDMYGRNGTRLTSCTSDAPKHSLYG